MAEQYQASRLPSISSARLLIPSGDKLSFQELNDDYVMLRGSLTTFVGDSALTEITVRPPVSDDEASFLRLISWSYVLVFEAGRISIPYLLKLPHDGTTVQSGLNDSVRLIHDLRTWSFHNLGFTHERDIGISTRVRRWFISNGGQDPPNNISSWGACFETLCMEARGILTRCKSAFEMILAGTEGGQDIIDDLKRRIELNWPAHKFDELTQDAVTRIGQTLDVPKFRQSRIGKWREFLETVAPDDEPQACLIRLIERDVIDYYETVLPIDGNDVMEALNLSPGPEVGDALRLARKIFKSGTIDPKELLESLKLRWAQETGQVVK